MIYKYFPFNFMWKGVCLIFSIVFLFKYIVQSVIINQSFFLFSLQAYKMGQANSVKIARIIAFTVILSSFILGSFILASTYLQAKATCDQVQALDAVLDKELMLETLQVSLLLALQQ